jgi:hypothetical protein
MNPILLRNHDYTQTAVGRVIDLRVKDVDGAPALVGIATFPENCPACDQALTEIRSGLVNTVSIGFFIHEAGPPAKGARGKTVTRSELIEISLVQVPACASCIIFDRDYRQEDPMLTTRSLQTCACHTNDLELSAEQVASIPSVVKSIFVEELAKHRAADVDVDAEQLRRVLPSLVAEVVADEIAASLRRAAGRVD